tara:strand:- start:1392 stop:1832 length:441 start_codon:yes stop_codon:yes gene_type:complete
MSYKGKYQLKNPSKYKGNPTLVIYRSLWERSYMKKLDLNENILEWSSEEIALPYKSPLDNRIHKYYPDFYVKERLSDGTIKKYIVEIKPKKQTVEPKVPKRKTKGYLYEVMEYAKNQAKWEVAEEWCADRGYEFKVLTENELFGYK